MAHRAVAHRAAVPQVGAALPEAVVLLAAVALPEAVAFPEAVVAPVPAGLAA